MERPKHLYRYRSMADDTQRERVRQILVDGLLYFAAPSTFNDPFDCWPLIDDRATEADYLRHARSLYGDSRKAVRQARLFAHKMAKGDPAHLDASSRALDTIRHALLNKHGVLCLNTNPCHQLMWSHYADCHRGVCFQFNGKHQFLEDAMPVHYSNQRALLNIFTQTVDEQVRNAVATKSEVWSYEDEWRIVETAFVGQKHFAPEALSAVVLGARIGATDAQMVRRWCAESPSAPKVFQATLIGDSYEIEIPGMSG